MVHITTDNNMKCVVAFTQNISTQPEKVTRHPDMKMVPTPVCLSCYQFKDPKTYKVHV
jgi:hypothetical protein